MKHLTLPNAITCIRILGAFLLIFLPFEALPFFIVYTICGISDILDGTIARLTHSQSDIGAKLDSISDLIFYAAMIIKVIPRLVGDIEGFVWIFGIVVILLRLSAYIVAAVKYRKFSSKHTYLNKLTGFCVFMLPYLLISPVNHTVACTVICIIGFAASAEELIIHLTSKSYTTTDKTLLNSKTKI